MIEVIGEDGQSYYVDDGVQGDVMGDVMGYGGPMGDWEGSAQIVGYDEYDRPIVVGARGRRRHPAHPARGRHLVSVKRPGWRGSQVAPGVIAPDQGMLPLPMSGAGGTNTFTATVPSITFQGSLQKPYRGERLLVSVVRTGVSATGRLLGQLFVGTDLQQADIPPVDIEQLGDPTAFGIRMAMHPAQPGVFIRILTNLSIPLVAPDTIQVSVQMLGRIVH